jgi:hypothetical protein
VAFEFDITSFCDQIDDDYQIVVTRDVKQSLIIVFLLLEKKKESGRLAPEPCGGDIPPKSL